MTRNEFLEHAIRRLIREGQPVTLDTVKPRIPAVIAEELTDDELVKVHAAVEGIELPVEPEPVERDLAELQHAPGGGVYARQPGAAKKIDVDIHDLAKPKSDLTQPEAVAALQAAQHHLAECRNVVRIRTQELEAARGTLHTAIQEYLASGERFTPLDAARDFQATAQAQRQARAAAGLNGVSASAKRYVQKRMANPTRGAFPQSWKGRTDPRYVPPESK